MSWSLCVLEYLNFTLLFRKALLLIARYLYGNHLYVTATTSTSDIELKQTQSRYIYDEDLLLTRCHVSPFGLKTSKL